MKKKDEPIRVNRPTLEPFSAYAPLFKNSIESGILTTGTYCAEFEKRAAAYLGVTYCVAVSSCTAGLMLVLKGLGLKGEVIMPSFTYMATGHPILWNGLTPVFAEVDPRTYTLDPASVERLITKKTSAIIATHVYGVPCDVKKLQRIARRRGLRLVYDAAHAFGSSVDGVRVGNFGDAEVFSLSPVKVLTAAEGGIVATNNKALADVVRLGRNYGDDGSGDAPFAGLSARFSELHAAIGLRSLDAFEKNLKRRRAKAAYLTAGLQKIEPRLIFQAVPKGIETTDYNFVVRLDPNVLGYTRDALKEFLERKGIATRKYFYPALHQQRAYKKYKPRIPLPVTEHIADTALALPMYSHITNRDLDRVLGAFREFTSTLRQ